MALPIYIPISGPLPMLLLLLLLLSRFSSIRLCATPETVAHQAPQSLDSPGKNTGVGCHFLLQCMKGKSESEVAQSCPTLCDPMDYSSARLLCPWNSPGQNTGVGSHSLLQGIFLTQGSNLGLLHCRQTLYRLSHKGAEQKDMCRRLTC